jgi:putative salt-induced outer membrane protein YdiY
MVFMKKKAFICLLGAGLAWSVAGYLPADTVIFKNGDRLSGDGCSVSGGKVFLTTPAAGKVELDAAAVKKIIFKKPVRVILPEGSEERASELSAAELIRVKSVNPPEIPLWSFDGRAGYSLSRGNSDTQDADLRAALVCRPAKAYRFTGRGEYAWGKVKNKDTDEDDTVTDRGSASLQADFFLIEDGYLYGRSRWSYDRIKDLDRRLENGAGLGYELFRNESSFLDVELGSSYIDSKYEDGSKDHGIYLRLAENGEMKINQRVSLVEQAEYLPQTENFSNYLFNAEAGVRVTLTGALYLQVSVLDRYDSSPPAGTDRNDVSVISSLGVSL